MDPMHPLLTMFQSSCCLKDLQKNLWCSVKMCQTLWLSSLLVGQTEHKGRSVATTSARLSFFASSADMPSLPTFAKLWKQSHYQLINTLQTFLSPSYSKHRATEATHIITVCIYYMYIYIYIILQKTSLRGSLHGQDDWTLWSHQTWNNIKHLDKHS